ncbi:hypothetical protein G9A89_018961 [Geosiphon pyriformis]|nr:hypothetical protein G9A89_018961 [Geosiphon pyriformis]
MHPMHPADFQAAVTNTRDFEAAELKANYAQAINLVMNESSELDSKLKQFSNSINQKLEGYLANKTQIGSRISCIQHPQSINSDNRKHMLATIVAISIETLIADYKLRNMLVINHQNFNLLTTNLSANNTHHLSTTAPTHLLAAVSGNLSVSTNLSTTTELTLKWNPETKTDTTKLEIVNGSLSTISQFLKPAIRILTIEFRYQELPKPEFPTLFKSLATITENESLDTIFLFELEELSIMPLFSGAALEKKPITAMYTDVKVDGHSINLILDSGSAGSIIIRQLMNQLGCQVDHTASTRIITTNGATKTLISKIDDFPIKVNSIIVPIKVLVMEATQYQALITTCSHFKTTNLTTPLIKFEEEEKKPTWEAYQKETDKGKEKRKEKDLTEGTTATEEITKNDMDTQNVKKSGTINYVLLAVNSCSMKECKTTFPDKEKCVMLPINCLDGYSHDEDKIWHIANAKIEGVMPSEILKIKNYPPEPVDIILIPNPDAFLDIKTGPEEFYEHYQNLALTKEEQEQFLEEINT